MIATARDAEENAASQMLQLGFVNVKVARDGADGGIDVECGNAIAQVKWRTETTGRPDVQRLYGARGINHDKAMLFFSASGYSKGAEVYADEVGMCLFIYNQTGAIVPASSAARALVTTRAAELAAAAKARAAESATDTAAAKARAATSATDTAAVAIAAGRAEPPAALMRTADKQWQALGFDNLQINPRHPCTASATNSADETLRVFWCGEVANMKTVRGHYRAATSYPRKHMVMVAGTKFSAEIKAFAQTRLIALFVWRADERLIPTNSAARDLCANPQPDNSSMPQTRRRRASVRTNSRPRSRHKVSAKPARPPKQSQQSTPVQPGFTMWTPDQPGAAVPMGTQVQPSRREHRAKEAREAKGSSPIDSRRAVRGKPRPSYMAEYDGSDSVWAGWVTIALALILGVGAAAGAVWLWWFVDGLKFARVLGGVLLIVLALTCVAVAAVGWKTEIAERRIRISSSK